MDLTEYKAGIMLAFDYLINRQMDDHIAMDLKVMRCDLLNHIDAIFAKKVVGGQPVWDTIPLEDIMPRRFELVVSK